MTVCLFGSLQGQHSRIFAQTSRKSSRIFRREALLMCSALLLVRTGQDPLPTSRPCGCCTSFVRRAEGWVDVLSQLLWCRVPSNWLVIHEEMEQRTSHHVSVLLGGARPGLLLGDLPSRGVVASSPPMFFPQDIRMYNRPAARV